MIADGSRECASRSDCWDCFSWRRRVRVVAWVVMKSVVVSSWDIRLVIRRWWDLVSVRRDEIPAGRAECGV